MTLSVQSTRYPTAMEMLEYNEESHHRT